MRAGAAEGPELGALEGLACKMLRGSCGRTARRGPGLDFRGLLMRNMEEEHSLCGKS